MQAALVWGILFAMTVRFGARPAVGFFVLALLSPSYVGLAGYVITDSGMMLWMVLTLLAWERVVTRGIRRDTLLLALCLFAGMASKHSFLLIPACLLVGTLGWGAIHRLRNRQEESQRFISLARKILLALVGALSLVYLLYAFSMRNMNTKVVEVYLRHFSRQSPPMLSEALEFSSRQRVLYPAGWYVAGVFRVVDMVHKGPSEIKIISSFGNQVYQGGRYFYFPAILMAKENLLVILLLAVIWLKKAREPWSKEARAIIVPSLVIALCYFLIAIRGSVNIGYRHIMPAYVCFLLATVLLLRQNGRGRFVDGALLGLLICRLTSLALTYPHQLSYFNWLAGGVKDGYKTSVISDADWGQDLLRLRDYVASRPPSRVHLFYASAADTGYYLGPLRALPPEPFRSGDLVAVSTTFLMIPDYLPADRLERLNLARTFPVDGQIGGSLVIFKVPPGY